MSQRCVVDADGYVVTNATGATSHPLVWAAGDIRRPPPLPHQVVLAAADGSAAAIDIHKTFVAASSSRQHRNDHRSAALPDRQNNTVLGDDGIDQFGRSSSERSRPRRA